MGTQNNQSSSLFAKGKDIEKSNAWKSETEIFF